jgi:hypothetical protein
VFNIVFYPDLLLQILPVAIVFCSEEELLQLLHSRRRVRTMCTVPAYFRHRVIEKPSLMPSML